MFNAPLINYSLLDKQVAFAINQAHLVLALAQKGYSVTLGEAYRTEEQAKLNAAAGVGIANSLHNLRLAIDLNLFQGATYLTRSEDYRVAGEIWKSLNTDNRWGGDFKTLPDGNHFSMTHEGVE